MLLKFAHPSLVTLIFILIILLEVLIPNETNTHDLLIGILVTKDNRQIRFELFLDLASNFADSDTLIQQLLAVKDDTEQPLGL